MKRRSIFKKDFVRYIHNLYVSPKDYMPNEVFPSDSKNKGVYTMQAEFLNVSTDYLLI